jgi:hypothetical protein
LCGGFCGQSAQTVTQAAPAEKAFGRAQARATYTQAGRIPLRSVGRAEVIPGARFRG